MIKCVGLLSSYCEKCLGDQREKRLRKQLKNKIIVAWAWCDGTRPGPRSHLRRREFRCWLSNENGNQTRTQVCTPAVQRSTWVTRYGGRPFYLLYHSDYFRDGHWIQIYAKRPWYSPSLWPSWSNQKGSSEILLDGWPNRSPSLSPRT